MSKLVTYEAVAAAADALVTAEKRPSVRSVMAQLGGGSPNAVLVHLNAWKAGRPLVAAAEIQLDPRIAQLVADQVQRAVADARSDVEQRLSEAEADAQALADAGREAESLLDATTQQLTAAQAQAQQLTGTIQQLQADAEQIKRDAADQVAAAQQQAADAVAKAEDLAGRERSEREAVQMSLAKAELRLEALPRLESEINRLQAALDVERAARSSAEADAAAAKAQAAGLADRLADAQQQAAQLSSVSNERLADQARAHQDLVNALRSELASLQQSLQQQNNVVTTQNQPQF